MNIEESQYLSLLNEIMDKGDERPDRTGVGTKAIFGTKLRFSLNNNTLPLLTTKKVFFKGVVEELLFFIRGETDTKKLEEKGVNIWKGNTSREFLDKRGLTSYPEGEMGPMYGYKWRNFHGIDQLKNIINQIKTDPYSRRLVVTAYDPSASTDCVLDPCHMFYQFFVNKDELSCQFYMRSCDAGLGLPFNLASYGLLTHMIANMCSLKAKELIFGGGDTHCYLNHIPKLNEQLTRQPFPFPKVKFKKEISSIEDMENLNFTDIELIDYKNHPAIQMSMAI